MEKLLTLFDGESEIRLDRSDLNGFGPTKTVKLFQTTAIYRDLLRDLEDPRSIGVHSVVAINGIEIKPNVVLCVERGFLALYERLEYLFGADSAAEIWAKTSLTIALSKCGD
jgi:hypothetical protein